MKHEGTTFSSYFSRSFHDFPSLFRRLFSWLRSMLRPSWKFSVASGLPIASRPTECEVSCYSWSRMVTTTLLDLEWNSMSGTCTWHFSCIFRLICELFVLSQHAMIHFRSNVVFASGSKTVPTKYLFLGFIMFIVVFRPGGHVHPHCLGTYLTHARTLKAFVFKVLRNGLLRYILYTCPNLM